MSDGELKAPTFDGQARDEYYWAALEQMFKERGYTTQDILRNYQAYIMRRDMPRFLSHYELFKQVIDLPGCIVELGVFRGASLFTWSKLMETFVPFDRTRKIFGFDHFEGLNQFSDADGKKSEGVQKVEGGYLATEREIQTLVDIHNADNMITGTKRVQIIPGDLMETLPKFLEDQPGLKISLLHFDVDLYKPTKFALETLYPYVLTGGVICFDEYGQIPWQGETQAVDEFFADFEKKPVIRKHHFAQTPHGYMIKE